MKNMKNLDNIIKNYILEQKKIKKNDSIRLKEKVKTNGNDFWEPMTVVDIINIKGNKYTLQSIDGDTAIVNLQKIKYEKL